MDDQLTEYRRHLILSEQGSQWEYDKALLSLSGGALGVSVVFLDKVFGGQAICSRWVLTVAWSCWCLSLAVVIASHFCSIKALRMAVKQVDAENRKVDTGKPRGLHHETPGGYYAKITDVCNALGGILFIVGLFYMMTFVWINT